MKACVVCQNELKDDARFCPNCGAEQPKVEVTPGEDPLLGAIVARKFKIEKILGVGGMGKVYKARQLALDKAVVVKVLHDQFRDDPQLVQRFQREARAASRLNHPNSIQIIDFGQDEGGIVFMAMEYLNGSDLFAHLKKEGPLDAPRLAKVMIQVCSALAEAHEMNVIHRDLKPENIMIEDRRGQRDFVKVLDFGIAKIQDPADTGGQALTQAGMVCGTPEYMSPEQARGLSLDPRSDIYALGIIMYQLSTGELPFTSDTPIGIVTKHILEKPISPRAKRPQIPEELERIILKAMEKEPGNRFDTVVQMGEALEAMARNLPALNAAGGTSGGFVAGPQTNGDKSGPNTAANQSAGGQSTSTGVGANAANTNTGASVTAVTPQGTELVGADRPGGSPAMKIAAAAVVVVVLAIVAAVAASKFGGSAVVDAGVVAVADAGMKAPPKVIDAGTTVAIAPPAVDAGTAVVTPVVDAGTKVAVADAGEPFVYRPPAKPDAGVAVVVQPKGGRAAAEPLFKRAVTAMNASASQPCSASIKSDLAAAATKDATWPDPIRYISMCFWREKNFAEGCRAAKEYERRGGNPGQAAQLKKFSCDK